MTEEKKNPEQPSRRIDIISENVVGKISYVAGKIVGGGLKLADNLAKKGLEATGHSPKEHPNMKKIVSNATSAANKVKNLGGKVGEVADIAIDKASAILNKGWDLTCKKSKNLLEASGYDSENHPKLTGLAKWIKKAAGVARDNIKKTSEVQGRKFTIAFALLASLWAINASQNDTPDKNPPAVTSAAEEKPETETPSAVTSAAEEKPETLIDRIKNNDNIPTIIVDDAESEGQAPKSNENPGSEGQTGKVGQEGGVPTAAQKVWMKTQSRIV